MIICYHQKLQFLCFGDSDTHHKRCISKHIFCNMSWKKLALDGTWVIP